MENKAIKQLVVSAIENGTVIDHIPANNIFKVVKILNLENLDSQITIGVNLMSKKYERKGIIKISNHFFQDEIINKISLVAPTATLIEIKNYVIVDKRQVEIPNTIKRIVKCVNPKCITNQQNVPTQFNVIDKDELKLQCHYCEKYTAKNNIVFV